MCVNIRKQDAVRYPDALMFVITHNYKDVYGFALKSNSMSVVMCTGVC